MRSKRQIAPGMNLEGVFAPRTASQTPSVLELPELQRVDDGTGGHHWHGTVTILGVAHHLDLIEVTERGYALEGQGFSSGTSMLESLDELLHTVGAAIPTTVSLPGEGERRFVAIVTPFRRESVTGNLSQATC
jgi:hypothetical protein